MADILFDIKNLSCSYNLNKEQRALFIENLQIPQGKLIFLLGASGCGKSTLLETLGLMNNTIADGEIVLNTSDTKKIDIHDLWHPNNYKDLTEVRKAHYSFIFQNTNLMENFTAYENVCLSGMIKQNVVQNEVLAEAKNLMAKVKLPESEVNLNTLSVNLSGGQRQRIAFVRALNNNATILLGDEPTGNLDEANANELFEIIRSELKDGLSAIIVSHDIDLAVKYADQIIVITKDKNKSYGEVHLEHIFNRENWIDGNISEIDGFKDKLRGFYTAGNEKLMNTDSSTSEIADTSLNYKKLFLRKEGKVLFGGKRLVNFTILTTILFFTFLAIGFAIGSLDYLKNKMNSAFVNWVTVSLPFSRSYDKSAMSQIIKELNNPENKKTYSYNDVTPYVKAPIYIWNVKISGFVVAEGRSVNFEDDSKLISEFVLNKDNFIRGKINGFKDKLDLGLIVTEEFLKENGYKIDANVVFCEKVLKDTVNKIDKVNKVPIPIRAIVKELPSKCKIIYTDHFYNSFLSYGDNSTAFDISTKNGNVELFYKESEVEKATQLKKEIEKYFADNKSFSSNYVPLIDQIADTLGYVGGYRYKIAFDKALNSSASSDSLVVALNGYLSKSVDSNLLQRTFSYDPYLSNAVPTYDEISVFFNSLDHVRDFAKYLKNDFNKNETEKIEVDVSKVKEKENFNFLSNIMKLISLLLAVFSLLSVCLFIFNLIRSHLSKVKMNIGTFKAIGLEDKEARNIYFEIIFYFIVLSCLVGITLASIVGYLGNKILVNSLTLEQDVSYFNIFHVFTLITFLIILSVSFYISIRTIKKMLNKTPGDLIYNR